jgi:hypothetical protein
MQEVLVTAERENQDLGSGLRGDDEGTGSIHKKSFVREGAAQGSPILLVLVHEDPMRLLHRPMLPMQVRLLLLMMMMLLPRRDLLMQQLCIFLLCSSLLLLLFLPQQRHLPDDSTGLRQGAMISEKALQESRACHLGGDGV